MSDGKGHRVRRVIRLRRRREITQPLDHVHHLFLFRPAIADHCLFDL